jgi:hypothetical protein
MKEMRKLISNMPNIVSQEMRKKDRNNFTNLYVYAIDSAKTVRVDDGISIDDKNVYVHIANPASVISKDSIIYIDAHTRLNDQLLLFHPDLCEELSLKPTPDAKYKLVVTVVLPYDSTTMTMSSLKHASVVLGYISTDKIFNITADNAEMIISKRDANDELVKLFELSNKFHLVNRKDQPGKSQLIVEVMMDHANTFLRKLMASIGFKGAFNFTSPLRLFVQYKAQIQLVHYLRKEIMNLAGLATATTRSEIKPAMRMK